MSRNSATRRSRRRWAFATIVQFFAIAINIGLMIAAGALVSRAIGAGDEAGARRLATSASIHGIIVSGILVLAMLPFLPTILSWIGADAETLPVAERFLWIALPSNLLMGPGMMFSGLLRAVGAARQAMYVTLGGAIVTAGLDPLLIFTAGLGIDGAAITTCVARATFALVGLWGVRQHRMLATPSVADVISDAPIVFRIALPAVLTNLAPSVASAFIAHALAKFGAVAVAGNVVIDRLTPVAFGGLFAMSGSIGPILGQNWGAGRFDRMRGVLRNGALVTAVYVVVVWAALIAFRGPLTGLFELTGTAADLFVFFCLVSGGRVVLHRATVPRQRLVQQSRLSFPVDLPQLGPRHHRNRAPGAPRRLSLWPRGHHRRGGVRLRRLRGDRHRPRLPDGDAARATGRFRSRIGLGGRCGCLRGRYSGPGEAERTGFRAGTGMISGW